MPPVFRHSAHRLVVALLLALALDGVLLSQPKLTLVAQAKSVHLLANIEDGQLFQRTASYRWVTKRDQQTAQGPVGQSGPPQAPQPVQQEQSAVSGGASPEKTAPAQQQEQQQQAPQNPASPSAQDEALAKEEQEFLEGEPGPEVSSQNNQTLDQPASGSAAENAPTGQTEAAPQQTGNVAGTPPQGAQPVNEQIKPAPANAPALPSGPLSGPALDDSLSPGEEDIQVVQSSPSRVEPALDGGAVQKAAEAGKTSEQATVEEADKSQANEQTDMGERLEGDDRPLVEEAGSVPGQDLSGEANPESGQVEGQVENGPERQSAVEPASQAELAAKSQEAASVSEQPAGPSSSQREEPSEISEGLSSPAEGQSGPAAPAPPTEAGPNAQTPPPPSAPIQPVVPVSMSTSVAANAQEAPATPITGEAPAGVPTFVAEPVAAVVPKEAPTPEAPVAPAAPAAPAAVEPVGSPQPPSSPTPPVGAEPVAGEGSNSVDQQPPSSGQKQPAAQEASKLAAEIALNNAETHLVEEEDESDKYHLDLASCAGVASESILRSTVEFILGTLSNDHCRQVSSGRLRLNAAANRRVAGYVMESSILPFETSVFTEARLTNVSCVATPGGHVGNSSENHDAGQDNSSRAVAIRLKFEQELEDQYLASRWRLYKRLDHEDLPSEVFRSLASMKSQQHGPAAHHYRSPSAVANSGNKCQRFDVEGGDFYLELLAPKTSSVYEIKLSPVVASDNSIKGNETATGRGPVAGVQLLEFNIDQLYLDHGIVKAQAAEHQHRQGHHQSAATNPYLRREQTTQVLHANNNHFRRSHWLLDLLANWLKLEYRGQLRRIASTGLLREHLSLCFDE